MTLVFQQNPGHVAVIDTGGPDASRLNRAREALHGDRIDHSPIGAKLRRLMRKILIFTGHNDRAVVALCRALEARQIAISLVASSSLDPIYKTSWGSLVDLRRGDRLVNLDLFQKIRASAAGAASLIYCPTTEFINDFALRNRAALEALDIHVPLPSREIYEAITNKSQSADLVSEICGLQPPPQMSWETAHAPCVFKPKANLVEGKVLYPLLCFADEEVQQAKERLDPGHWFAQTYVEGQSHYLCGYLSRDGAYHCYWQTNLMQQPGGKSIVLAKTGKNPGFDERRFFNGLHDRGYFGPVMMELIESPGHELYFIEINPRFWGPLQLGVDACPPMLDLYVQDIGFEPTRQSTHAANTPDDGGHNWYAWAKGAQQENCRLYPAADGLDATRLLQLLAAHDLYAREDTRSLAGVH